MSPASQGALEVERYIGSCLISSNGRLNLEQKPLGCRKEEQVYRPARKNCSGNFWPGANPAPAPPFLNMGQNPRRNHQRPSPPNLPNPHRIPLSRLAVHTQGAPLILTGRIPSRPASAGNVVANTPRTSQHQYSNQQRHGKPVVNDQAKKQQLASRLEPQSGIKDAQNGNIDSLSVASDESSGSNNSENSLPRIIKPRKRRKKDRKPMVTLLPSNATPAESCPKIEETKESPPVASAPVPIEQNNNSQRSKYGNTYELARYSGEHKNHRRLQNNNVRQNNSTDVIDTRQLQRNYIHRHVQFKVLDDNRNVIVPVTTCQPKGYIRHSMPPGRYICDYDGQDAIDECLQGTICICRHCDSGKLVWDVEQGAYVDYQLSGNIHHQRPVHQCYSQVPVILGRPYVCQDRGGPVEYYGLDGTCPRMCDRDNAMLRRSWSDPTSYFTDEIVPNRGVGVIGDRQATDSSKSRNVWRGDAASVSSISQPSSPGGSSIGSQGLEVSTEIVTSPNGHRDLEIKFYSTSPCSVSNEQDKMGFTFPEDEAEDYNDIWTYHENKLQQDFRTLLQAEE